jgi:hypothetical protein
MCTILSEQVRVNGKVFLVNSLDLVLTINAVKVIVTYIPPPVPRRRELANNEIHTGP